MGQLNPLSGVETGPLDAPISELRDLHDVSDVIRDIASRNPESFLTAIQVGVDIARQRVRADRFKETNAFGNAATVVGINIGLATEAARLTIEERGR